MAMDHTDTSQRVECVRFTLSLRRAELSEYQSACADLVTAPRFAAMLRPLLKLGSVMSSDTSPSPVKNGCGN